MLLNYPVGKGPCYRCIFPKPPAPETVLGCSEIGVLGTVVGTVGVLMAGEVIRIAARSREEEVENYKPSLLLYNGWSKDPRAMFRVVGMRARRKGCPACDQDLPGSQKITRDTLASGRLDYAAFCGIAEDVKVLGPSQRIAARAFAGLFSDDHDSDAHQRKSSDIVIVDTREPNEVEIGPKLMNAINIPFSKILRNSSANSETSNEGSVWQDIFNPASRAQIPIEPDMRTRPARLSHEDPETLSPASSSSPPRKVSVYFVCQRGNDSQLAAKRLMESSVRDKVDWIGDIEGGFVALQREVFGSPEEG